MDIPLYTLADLVRTDNVPPSTDEPAPAPLSLPTLPLVPIALPGATLPPSLVSTPLHLSSRGFPQVPNPSISKAKKEGVKGDKVRYEVGDGEHGEVWGWEEEEEDGGPGGAGRGKKGRGGGSAGAAGGKTRWRATRARSTTSSAVYAQAASSAASRLFGTPYDGSDPTLHGSLCDSSAESLAEAAKSSAARPREIDVALCTTKGPPYWTTRGAPATNPDSLDCLLVPVDPADPSAGLVLLPITGRPLRARPGAPPKSVKSSADVDASLTTDNRSVAARSALIALRVADKLRVEGADLTVEDVKFGASSTSSRSDFLASVAPESNTRYDNDLDYVNVVEDDDDIAGDEDDFTEAAVAADASFVAASEALSQRGSAADFAAAAGTRRLLRSFEGRDVATEAFDTVDGGADADDDVLSGRAAADSTTLESSLLSDMSGTASVLGDTSNMSTNDLQALAAERAAQDEREQAATVLARAKRKRDDAASGTADLLSLSPSSVASFISARGMVTTEELMRAAKPLLRTDEDLRRFPVTVKRVATMEVVDGVNYLRATQ
jgi:hypothetical protein